MLCRFRLLKDSEQGLSQGLLLGALRGVVSSGGCFHKIHLVVSMVLVASRSGVARVRLADLNALGQSGPKWTILVLQMLKSSSEIRSF